MSHSSTVPAANVLRWSLDTATAEAAGKQRLDMLSRSPAAQIKGCGTERAVWDRRVVQPATWHDPLRSDPKDIIKQFTDRCFTQGLALVVSWGGMGRHPERIYGDESRETILRIERTLSDCAANIRTSQSIEVPWALLTGRRTEQLGWSAVMASKALHFLCRALGYEPNPPVPIDGEVIRGRLWPLFRYSLSSSERVGNWEGDDIAAYCRYMTAVLTWADQRQWTTTQMEATIYEHFKQP